MLISIHDGLFFYSYSDFPDELIDILAKYYDAYFYIANWGGCASCFPFAKKLVDVKALKPYCVEDVVTWEIVGEYLILELQWHGEDSFDAPWVEGEGCLNRFQRGFKVYLEILAVCV